MKRSYGTLLRLYPDDVRFAYGDEMRRDFEVRWACARERRWYTAAAVLVSQVLYVVCDAAAERANALYSHRTFHGRCRPDPGSVRPPNMGKHEWFRSDSRNLS